MPRTSKCEWVSKKSTAVAYGITSLVTYATSKTLGFFANKLIHESMTYGIPDVGCNKSVSVNITEDQCSHWVIPPAAMQLLTAKTVMLFLIPACGTALTYYLNTKSDTSPVNSVTPSVNPVALISAHSINSEEEISITTPGPSYGALSIES